ncbi:MAG: FAD binding domain-containing protein [Beijerinckiaceae bacterium]
MFVRPLSLDAAVTALAQTGGRIFAGGTDIMPALVDRPTPPALVDITRIPALRAISAEAEGLRIGGCATWSDILAAELPSCLDGLKAAAREIGARQIQNAGTIGGNLCNASPAADSVPPLMTVDASVELFSRAGRRVMPLAEFILGNRRTALQAGDIMTAVLVPAHDSRARSVFLKLGARRYLVISIAMVSAVIVPDNNGHIGAARIAVGACSAVAQRLPLLERDLIGQPLTPRIADAVKPLHLADLTPIDDGRASAEYRRDAALTLVRRALAACCLEHGHA